MNGLPNSFGYIGLAVGVVSSIFAYFNRDRYRTLINDIYKPGNQELREQLATARTENADLTSQKTALQAQVNEKEKRIKDLKELNARLPDYKALKESTDKVTTTLSDNHAQTMSFLADLAKKIVK